MKKSLKIIILCILILLTLLFEITGFSIKLGSYYIYLIKPLIWLFIGILSFFFLKSNIIVNKKYKKFVNFNVIVAILIYFLIYFSLGYITGFAYNPYDNSIKGILTNLWVLIPVTMVREYLRYFMINNCEKKHILWWTLVISLVFTLMDLNLGKINDYFLNSTTLFEFLIEIFVPSLITNLFLTYISYFSGTFITILYCILPQIALYVLPILPDLEPAVLAVLNSMIPFFTYIYINYLINKMDKTLNRKKYKTMGVKGWVASIAFVVLMMCFGLGVFPIEPLVIASNSMYPKIHKGDIVFIEDIDVKDLKKGDVIRYKLDNYYVVHRIVMVTQDKNGKLLFITKGDNNNSIDLLPVKENQVKGIIRTKISYVGYPTIVMNKLLNTGVGDTVKVDKGRVD